MALASGPRWFDLCGILSVLALLGVVAADLDDIRLGRTDAPLTVSAADLDDGFRTGVTWFGLHLDEARVGFARVERRITRSGRQASSHVTLRPVVLGTPVTVEADLDLTLDDQLRPTTFELRSTAAGVEVSASGRRRGDRFDVDLDIAGTRQRLELPAAGAWTDLGLRTAFLRSRPEPGERREARLLDPLGLRSVTMTIEYVGIEDVAVLGQVIPAHHLRHEIEDQVLEVWVNDLGEALHEEMPLGLTAIRETEAAATYGFGRGAPPPEDAVLDLDAVTELVAGLQPSPPGGRR